MELRVTEVGNIKPIDFNFEELKAELTEKLKQYNTMMYTEDNMKLAKADRANLNKLAKALNDRKIDIKNQVLQPYIPFEEKIKELIGLVNDASAKIDGQVKTYEDKLKKDKINSIEMMYEACVGELKRFVPLDRIFKAKWLNATERLANVEKELMEELDRIRTEYATLQGEIEGSPMAPILKHHYFESLSLPRTLAYKKGLEAQTDYTQPASCQQVTEPADEVVFEVTFKVKATAQQLNVLKNCLVTSGIKFEKV